MAVSSQTTSRPRHEVSFTRVFDAPPALVWRAWTDPAHVARWWGPHGFTNPRCEWDARPGGHIWVDMTGPDGTVYPMSGVFHEAVAPERLVFTAVAEDKEGRPLLESRTTVTFAARGAKTEVTVHASAVGIADIGWQMLQGMNEGWSQSLERLAEHLAKERSA